MKKIQHFLVLTILTCLASCDHDLNITPDAILPELTTTIPGYALTKVLRHRQGWVSLQETIQTQLLITLPKRKLVWYNDAFQEISSYEPPTNWSLIDAVVHKSGQVSAVILSLNMQQNSFFSIKLLRLENGITKSETVLQPLPGTPETIYFPASLDRVRLEVYDEDVYVVARWDSNQVEASRFGFNNNSFQLKWQTLVEPEANTGSFGIIGGGYDNFHQGDRYFFVYSGVDSKGNLFVGIPSHEELLINHDAWFHESLLSGANPNAYEWGVAIVTKLSSAGERLCAQLVGGSNQIRLLNMRVGEGNVYLVGRIKTGSEPGSWDGWIHAADSETGNRKFESQINIQDGDMFWDISPLHDGGVLAVGSKGYFQNPGGLSVSDSRLDMAVVLDNQGNMQNEIELPQGPVARGSEAMFVTLIGNNNILFAGVHNAPGTHADVYCDGFIAVRDLSIEQ